MIPNSRFKSWLRVEIRDREIFSLLRRHYTRPLRRAFLLAAWDKEITYI